MSQCCALFYPYRSKLGYYCVLRAGHWGKHKTDSGELFSEDEAKYFAKELKPDRDATLLATIRKKPR